MQTWIKTRSLENTDVRCEKVDLVGSDCCHFPVVDKVEYECGKPGKAVGGQVSQVNFGPFGCSADGQFLELRKRRQRVYSKLSSKHHNMERSQFGWTWPFEWKFSFVVTFLFVT